MHYMTAYRYVRTGRLPASQREGVWEVERRDLDRLRKRAVGSPAGRGRSALPRRVPELVERLVVGDEPGAWSVAQLALAGGATPAALYMEIFVPALRMIGTRWEEGQINVGDEHCASAVMQRLIGRTGPLFRRPGRKRGIVVLGAPEGELHGMPTALAADLLRGRGFVVVDLGADVPSDSFAECVRRLPRVIAVAITVTTKRRDAAVRRLVAALRAEHIAVPIMVGGSGIDEQAARRLGADAWGNDAPQLEHLLAELVR